LTIFQELHVTATVVVTTPQTVATDDVRRAIRMLQEIKAPIAGVVENMSYFIDPVTSQKYFIFGEHGGEILAQDYGIPFLGQIPLDSVIREGSDVGTPVTASDHHQQKKYFNDIVDRLFAQIPFQVKPREGDVPATI
jgi:ATP-binding protein involved in chromosome partitioning